MMILSCTFFLASVVYDVHDRRFKAFGFFALSLLCLFAGVGHV